MPVTEHLEWHTVTDFSKGLWTADGSFLMPGTAFQTMEGAFPQPGGGLRAFYKPTAIVTTGIGSTSLERPIAYQEQRLADLSAYQLLLTKVISGASEGQIKAYYKLSGASSWTLTKTFAAHASQPKTNSATVAPYQDSSNVYYFVVAVNNSGADIGTWTFRPDTAAWSKLDSTAIGPVIVYQGRIVVATLTFGTIIWTEPGGVTFPAANYLDMYQGYEDFRVAVSGMTAAPPQQLYLMTAHDRHFTIEGDIDDPVVTGFAAMRGPGIMNNIEAVEDGILFYESGIGNVLAMNNGSNFQQLDSQLEPSLNIPDPAVAHFPYPGWGITSGFYFTPDGRVYDLESQAWFTLPETRTVGPFLYFKRTLDGQVYGLPWVTGWAPYVWTITANSTAAARYETWTIKTAPLRDPKARRLSVREVQVNVKSLHANSRICVTVGGVTRNSGAIAVGTNRLRFLFNARSEYQDVQIVGASNNSGTEAPILESLAIGSRPNEHLFR